MTDVLDDYSAFKCGVRGCPEWIPRGAEADPVPGSQAGVGGQIGDAGICWHDPGFVRAVLLNRDSGLGGDFEAKGRGRARVESHTLGQTCR